MSSVTTTSTASPQRRLGGVFTPESELLLSCCAVGERESRERDLRASLAADVDWQQVRQVGEQHGVLPLVYQAVREFPDLVPRDALAELRRHYVNNARRNLKFTGELLRILDCLEGHGIAAIAYKGPVLAEIVYGDLAARDFSDLDVLVRPADVPRTKAALQVLDYRPSSHFSETVERAYLATGYEFTFDGPAGRNLLEIQWGIVPRFYAVDFVIDEYFERARPAELSGHAVNTLSPEDLLLALCVHAAKHAWVRLCWLHDIAGVVESQPLDWRLIEKRARDLGIRRILGVSLVLAHRLLSLKNPNALKQSLRDSAEIERLVGEISSQMQSPNEYNTESLRYFRLMIRLRERVGDKLRFALRLALTPSIGEWKVVSLPAALFPLYRVIRVFRLAGKLASLGRQNP